MSNLEFHPVADLLPLMAGTEFDALVQDIRENGLLEPIWLHPEDGSIIDGRNRYRACLDAGVEPKTRTWDGKGSLVSFVLSMNVKRRHLTTEQQTHIALASLPFYRKEAEARKVAAGKLYGTGSGKENSLVSNETNLSRKVLDGQSTAAAAKAIGISRATVTRARAVQQHAPELYKKVSEGKLTFAKASRMMKTEIQDRPRTQVAVARQPKVPVPRSSSDVRARLRAGALLLADGRAHTLDEVERKLGGGKPMLDRLTMADWLTVLTADGKYEFVVDAELEAICAANPPQPALGNLSAYRFLKNLRKQIIARREKDLTDLAEEIASGRSTSEESRAAPLAATLNWIEDEFDKIDVSYHAPLYTTLKELRKEVTRKREEARTKRNLDLISTLSEFSRAHKLNPILDLIENTLAGLDINPLGRD